MGRAGLVVGLAIAAVAVSGCAAVVPGDGSSGTPLAQSTEASARQRFGAGLGGTAGGGDGQAVSGPTFPLTLRRTGGIAGFDDTIVLRANGQVLVSTRAVHGRVCRLTAPQQQKLLAALASLRLETVEAVPSDSLQSSDDGEASDPILITITDLRARPVDLSDPSLGEVAGLVGALVADVTLSTPATTSCTTAPSPGRAGTATAGVVGAG